MPVIQSESGLQEKRIGLETKEGNPILNRQDLFISSFVQSQFPDYEKNYSRAIFRSEPTSIYNCHGLSFASRRTGIHETAEIYKILHEDKYAEVSVKDVLPGDLVLYFSTNGDIEHSGVVLDSPKDCPMGMPKIYSKWGSFKEAIHYANYCPKYDPSNLKYYRIKE